MNSIDRKQKILAELKVNGNVGIPDLSKLFGVSDMTIRRDLVKLSEQGLVTLERGGAVLNSGSLFEYTIPLKQKEHMAEKALIAEKSMEYVREGNSIYLDAGTTAAEIAKRLRSQRNIIVITHSLLAANFLSGSPEIKIIMCPGEYRERSMAFMGPLTTEFISKFKIDTFFLGTEGIDLKNGLTLPDIADGSIKWELVKNAEKVICVADHSKFDKSFLYKVCPLNDIDMIITDDSLPGNTAEQYQQQDIRLILAKKPDITNNTEPSEQPVSSQP